ncbi:hypothetical protein AVEN_10726-1 [Araneus ventricosus]|uniref:RNase H type-1 domain-containing protein n=1 Tax=Araneus ventricosus TaxID=182803 RepID=A0A4Y2G4S0_ARAVE|nr:hypothetical protein AVEN_10726-1 [Araneus ventricosus]
MVRKLSVKTSPSDIVPVSASYIDDLPLGNRKRITPALSCTRGHLNEGSLQQHSKTEGEVLRAITPNPPRICVGAQKDISQNNTLAESHSLYNRQFILPRCMQSRRDNLDANGHVVSYKLHSFISVFSSEISAVYFALKYIDEHEIRKSILYTDSMSLWESLRSPSTHNPLIKEVKDFYRHLLSKGARIPFSSVPSHVGITGNELADKSAKSATEFLTRPIVYADVGSAVNQWCY